MPLEGAEVLDLVPHVIELAEDLSQRRVIPVRPRAEPLVLRLYRVLPRVRYVVPWICL